MIRRFIVAFCISLVLLPLVASAQESSASGQIEQSSQTSPEEKIQFTDMALAEMRESVKQVAKMVEASEREKNMVAIQCLSRKLTTMRALLEVSESSGVSLKQALADGEYQTAEHEYRKIAVALNKVRQFRAEADACGGGGGAKPGQTHVEVVESAISTDDETEPPQFEGEFGNQPPPTSQFQ
jgi:hypothetical protein